MKDARFRVKNTLDHDEIAQEGVYLYLQYKLKSEILSDSNITSFELDISDILTRYNDQ